MCYWHVSSLSIIQWVFHWLQQAFRFKTKIIWASPGIPLTCKKHQKAVWRHLRCLCASTFTPSAPEAPHHHVEAALCWGPGKKLVSWREMLSLTSGLFSVIQSLQSWKYFRMSEAGCIPPCQIAGRAEPGSNQHQEILVAIREKKLRAVHSEQNKQHIFCT